MLGQGAVGEHREKRDTVSAGKVEDKEGTPSVHFYLPWHGRRGCRRGSTGGKPFYWLGVVVVVVLERTEKRKTG